MNEITKGQTNKTNLPSELSPTAQKLVAKLENVSDVEALTQYGADSQGHISAAAQKATDELAGRQVGEIGDQLGQLMVAIKTPLDDTHSNGLLARVFHRAKQEALTVKSKYQNVGVTINTIGEELQKSSDKLKDDNAVLHQLFDDNRKYYGELDDYINAGLVRLNTLDKEVIPAKVKEVDDANGNEQQLKAQELSQLQAFRDRLSKRVYSLQLSQQLALQQIAQVNLIARNNNAIRDQISDALVNSIPLWKSQVATRLAAMDSQRASDSLKATTEASKAVMLSNAKMIHDATIEQAKDSQKAFIDEQTLSAVQDSIVSALQGYQQIIADGRKQRKEATARLQNQTQKMKDQILQASKSRIALEQKKDDPKRLENPFDIQEDD